MLDFLFRRLTADRRGTDLFAAVTSIAREPHWYVEGKLPDTIDGRFAVLATVTALVLVRLERDEGAGDSVSVALTERFIEVMESEHRELGLGDPTLGKRVRKLVGSLSRRTDLWRLATTDEIDWSAAARESLGGDASSATSPDHCARALKRFWSRLGELDLAHIERGKLR